MEVPLLAGDFLRRRRQALSGARGRHRWGVAADLRGVRRARVNQLANARAALGVAKGDRVAILSPNSHKFLEVLYATHAMGAVVVPINYRLIASDFEYVLNHSGTKVAVVDSDYAEVVDGLRGKAADRGALRHGPLRDGGCAAGLGGLRRAGRGAAGDAAAGSGPVGVGPAEHQLHLGHDGRGRRA